MHHVSKLAFGRIEKELNSGGFAIDKASRFERDFRPFKIFGTKQDIDILRIANRRLINSRYPGCHGVATNDRIGNGSRFQHLYRTEQSQTYFFHGTNHPVQ